MSVSWCSRARSASGCSLRCSGLEMERYGGAGSLSNLYNEDIDKVHMVLASPYALMAQQQQRESVQGVP